MERGSSGPKPRSSPRVDRGRNGRDTSRLRTLVASVVTFVWAGSFVADITTADYAPDPSIHLVMMVIAGGLFGHEIVRRARNGG